MHKPLSQFFACNRVGSCPTNFQSSTQRRIFSDISNGVSANYASPYASRDNMTSTDLNPRCARNRKRGAFGSEVFVASRQTSKTHGDLSCIRPKSPPFYTSSATLGGLQFDGQPTERPCPSYRETGDYSYASNSESHTWSVHEGCIQQDSPELAGPLTVLPHSPSSTSEHEHEPTERLPFRVCSTNLHPQYLSKINGFTVCKDA